MKGDTKKFQVGDKVKLNTGGPEMSIEDVQSNICVCRWFVNGLAKTGKFVGQCLVPVVNKPPIIHGKRKELVTGRD